MVNVEKMLDDGARLKTLLEQSNEEGLLELILELNDKDLLNATGYLFYDEHPRFAHKYFPVLTNLCLHEIVKAKSKKIRERLSVKFRKILYAYFADMNKYTEAGYDSVTGGEWGTSSLQIGTMRNHKRIRKLAKTIGDRNKNLSKTAIAKILKSTHDITLAESTIRNIIRDRK